MGFLDFGLLGCVVAVDAVIFCVFCFIRMKNVKNYPLAIAAHYTKTWGEPFAVHHFKKGPMHVHCPDFAILEFAPSVGQAYLIYATSGMSLIGRSSIELHLFSATQDESLVELLTAIAYYNATTEHQIGVGHTLYFGRSWQQKSQCTYGLVSLPYMDGPSVEDFKDENKVVKCYWLIPITPEEQMYKVNNGVEALELALESANFNYINPERKSVV